MDSLQEDEVKLMVMMVMLKADLVSIGCSGHSQCNQMNLMQIDLKWKELYVVDCGKAKL